MCKFKINIHLNKLIDNGVNFTVATARTPATVVDLLQDVNLKLPAVLMNGVLLYDIKEEKYITKTKLPPNPTSFSLLKDLNLVAITSPNANDLIFLNASDFSITNPTKNSSPTCLAAAAESKPAPENLASA